MSAAPRRLWLVAYGLPGLAAALPVIPVTVLLPAWYARELGLGLVLTGTILGAVRLLDFFTDPLFGLLADRRAGRGLRFKPWIALGGAAAGAGLVLLAQPGFGAAGGTLMPLPGGARLALGSVLLFTGWTALMIPYTAWGAELGATQHARTLFAGSREIAGLLGMLVALALPLAAAVVFDLVPVPFVLLTLAAFVLGVPGIAAALLLVPEPAATTGGAGVSMRDLRELLGQRDYRTTLLCWFVNGVANGLPAALFPIVVQDYFGFSQPHLFGLLALYFGSAVLAAPAWVMLSRRRGKRAVWRTAMLLNVCVFAPVLLLSPDMAPAFWIVCALSGSTLGADLALPAALQADVMAADRASSGRARTASAFALWSMATKLALAVAVATAFIGVGSGGDGAAVACWPLMACYVALPVALKLALWWLLTRPGIAVPADVAAGNA